MSRPRPVWVYRAGLAAAAVLLTAVTLLPFATLATALESDDGTDA